MNEDRITDRAKVKEYCILYFGRDLVNSSGRTKEEEEEDRLKNGNDFFTGIGGSSYSRTILDNYKEKWEWYFPHWGSISLQDYRKAKINNILKDLDE